MAHRGSILSAFFLTFLAVFPAAAQEDERITRLEQKLDELLRQADAIRTELNELKGGAEDLTAVETVPQVATPAPSPQEPALTDVQTVDNVPATGASKALNPDISVLGTF